MTPQEIVTVVQSIGFPIVMCGCMGWFVYFMYNKNQSQIDQIMLQHKQETEQLQNAIDNNTIALTKVIDVINTLNK